MFSAFFEDFSPYIHTHIYIHISFFYFFYFFNFLNKNNTENTENTVRALFFKGFQLFKNTVCKLKTL